MAYFIALVAIVIIGVGYSFYQTDNRQTPAVEVATETLPPIPSTPGAPATTAELEAQVKAKEKYKNGTYTAETTYLTPQRDEYGISVTFKVIDGRVAESVVSYSRGAEKDPNAKRFDDAYKAQVLGQTLDGINLSRVGGASLTTNAFNKALLEIKSDATS